MSKHLQIVYPKTRTTRPLMKRVPLQGGGTGFTTVPDGTEELYYQTEIQLELLHEMARRAAGNKRATSSMGALTVTIISRRKLP
jgi:hypothetical protein